MTSTYQLPHPAHEPASEADAITGFLDEFERQYQLMADRKDWCGDEVPRVYGADDRNYLMGVPRKDSSGSWQLGRWTLAQLRESVIRLIRYAWEHDYCDAAELADLAAATGLGDRVTEPPAATRYTVGFTGTAAVLAAVRKAAEAEAGFVAGSLTSSERFTRHDDLIIT